MTGGPVLVLAAPIGVAFPFLTSAFLTSAALFLSISVFVPALSWGGAMGATRVVAVEHDALEARKEELFG